MENIEYGDFHKFIVSLGVASFGIAFIVPWLFLKEPFDLLLESKKIAELTQEAQRTLEYRQDMVYTLFKMLPWISLAFGIIGIVLIVWGLPKWSRKQNVSDIKAEIDLKKAEKELLQELSPSEAEKKAISESIQGGQLENSPWGASDNMNSPLRDRNEIISSYYRIKEAAFGHISTQLGVGYVLLKNQKINDFEYDVIAQASMPQTMDILIEIKYFRKPEYHYVVDAVNRAARSNKGYEELLGRKAKSVILFFAVGDIDIDEYMRKAAMEKGALSNQIITRFIVLEDMDRTDYSEILMDDGELEKTNSLLCSAIRSKKVVKFLYNGLWREAEPFCYGIGSAGNELLRAYQTGGESESGNAVGWRLFKVSDILELTIIDKSFKGDRPFYSPKDKAMDFIYCNI